MVLITFSQLDILHCYVKLANINKSTKVLQLCLTCTGDKQRNVIRTNNQSSSGGGNRSRIKLSCSGTLIYLVQKTFKLFSIRHLLL